jgi:hypothetical protein
VALVHEAMQRGETSGGPAAMTTVQWVRHHAPSTRAGGAGGAGAVVAVAQAFQKRVNAPVKEAVEVAVCRSARLLRWSASTRSCGRCSGS